MGRKKLALSVLVMIGLGFWGSNNANATTWYVRDGGGTATQCTGKTNAVYPGSGSAQACAFNHPAWVIGGVGTTQLMAAGDTLYIVGDSDNTWNFTVSGVTTLPSIGDEYTTNGVTYTVTVSLPIGFTSGQIAMTGSTLPPSSGTLTVVSGHGSGTSPITYTATSIAQAQFMIGYGMPNNLTTGACNTGSPLFCSMQSLPAGVNSSTETKVLGLVGSDGIQPQLWGTEGVQWVIAANGAGNYDIENLEITSHSICGQNIGSDNPSYGIYPAKCASGYSYPSGPSAAAATWAQSGLLLSGTNLTTKNLWVHRFGSQCVLIQTLSNWNSTNDKFTGGSNFLTADGTSGGTMSFGGTNSMTNDVWAFGGCEEKYPLPDAGNVKDTTNYLNCADQSSGGYQIGGGFMMQNGTNGACGNWNVAYTQFLFNLKTNWDFLHCNGTGTVNIYRSRLEGSDGEQLKMDVSQVNVEESQIIGDDLIWNSPAFQAIKAPYSNSNGSWSYYLCRGNAVFISATNSGEQMNFVNDDVTGECTALFQTTQAYSFNSCTGIGLNVYNSKLIGGYGYDIGKTLDLFYNNGSGSCATTTATNPATFSYDSCYNLAASSLSGGVAGCTNGTNMVTSDPKVLFEAATPIASELGPTAYATTTSLGDQLYLQSTSPLIKAGTANVTYTNGSSNDYNNYAADVPPDIGAIQYNSCISNSTGNTNGFCSINGQCCGGTCASAGQCGTGSSTPQPVVAITNPTNETSVSSGSNVTITATASETNGTITNISLYNGGTLLGSSSSSAYTYTMTDPADGTYTLTAKATDANGVSTTSSAVTVTVTAQSLPSSPVVNITSPASGSSYTAGSIVTVTTTASETNGTIASISLYNGSGILLGTSTTSPYNYVDSNMAAGGYSFYAVATDANGVSTTSSAITVTVTAAAIPVVTITSPANGNSLTAGSNITIAANASETNGTISKVQFYNGSTLLGTDTTSPYSYTWNNVPAGNYTLTAKATDASGVTTTSSAIIVTVIGLPTVSLAANNTTFTAPATINLTATASETNGTISKVEFFNGSSLLGTVTSSPYTYTWSNVAAGNYSLTAEAFDNSNNTATSTAVAVSVTIAGVAPSITAQPVSETVTAPATATFTVTASGTPAPAYQWMQSISGGVFTNISGAISSSYTTAATTTTNSGNQFKCVVTNASGNVTSSAATLTVNPAPVAPSITSQPVSETVTAPATATFAVAASGTPAPTFQWMQSVNGGAFSNISGATSASYTTGATTVANSGTQFECVVTNASGSVTSNAATLTVNSAPSLPTVSLTAPSNNASFAAPATVFLSANASEANGTIAQVQFFNGSTLLYTAASAPYNYTWASNLLPGSYTLTARATDSRGVVVTSAPVTINIALSLMTPPSAPVVAITSPASGSSIAAGSNLTITASASETNGTIAVVYFYNGSIFLGSSSTSPYSYTMTNVPVGSYTLTAKAVDTTGHSVTSSPIAITVTSATPVAPEPVVTITSPSNGNSFISGSNFTIMANASETAGTGTLAQEVAAIAQVQFYNGSALLGTSATSPYTLNWSNVPAGTYTLIAKATDTNGVSTTSSPVTVTVATPSLPVVALTNPVNGGSYATGSSVTISANASEINGTIAQVQFYNGSTLLGTDTTSPYSFTWNNVLAGSYTLTAKATDAYGVSTTSNAVVVTVTAVPPVIAITSPANGSSLTAGSDLTITANASEVNGTIAQVQFYNGSTLLGTDTTSPYSYTWSNVPAGTYTLTAKATDANGVSTTSSAVTITAATAAPAPAPAPVPTPTPSLPVVTITGPSSGDSVTPGSDITFTVNASDTNDAITQVQIYNGSTLLYTTNSASFNYTWAVNLLPGSYNLTAQATNANGEVVTSAPVTIKITLPGIGGGF